MLLYAFDTYIRQMLVWNTDNSITYIFNDKQTSYHTPTKSFLDVLNDQEKS